MCINNMDIELEELIEEYKGIEKQETETLEHFLEKRVFVTDTKKLVLPDLDGVQGFDRYMARYKQAIAVEKMASELFTRGDKSC